MGAKDSFGILSSLQYDAKDLIGHGAFSIVLKGWQRKNHMDEVAIKIISKRKIKVSQNFLDKEIKFLNELTKIQHENVVFLFECIEDPMNMYLIMDYCNGGDLRDYLDVHKILSENTLKLFTKQLAKGLHILNKNRFICSDLKPQNILLKFNSKYPTRDIKGVRLFPKPEEICLKIDNFGTSRFLPDRIMACAMCSSPIYVAPEIIMPSRYAAKVDLWSLGTILYECLIGTTTFCVASRSGLEPMFPNNVSEELKDLLSKLLKKNPHERISLVEFINHPFLREGSSILKPKSRLSSFSEIEHQNEENKITKFSITSFDHFHNQFVVQKDVSSLKSESRSSSLSKISENQNENKKASKSRESKNGSFSDLDFTGSFKTINHCTDFFTRNNSNGFDSSYHEDYSFNKDNSECSSSNYCTNDTYKRKSNGIDNLSNHRVNSSPRNNYNEPDLLYNRKDNTCEKDANGLSSAWNENIESFDAMNLNEKLLKGIQTYGIEKPTLLQKRAIFPCINDRNVMIQAQTGAGKTIMFSIAVLQRINTNSNDCQALILEPRRELALQTQKVILNLGLFMEEIKCQAFIGGTDVCKDLNNLKENGAHVVVGTSGRIFELVNRRSLRLNHLKILVLNEADELLTPRKDIEIYKMFRHLQSKKVQVILLSTMMTADVLKFSKQFVRNSVKISIKAEDSPLKDIRQFYINVGTEEWKLDTLCDLYDLLNINRAIIFCNTSNKVDELRNKILATDRSVLSLHIGSEQKQRDEIIKSFESDIKQVLITTDLAVIRGIDLKHVPLIINYDIPLNPENYIYRITRGNRIGSNNVAITFVTENDTRALTEIEQFYNTKLEEMPDNVVEFL